MQYNANEDLFLLSFIFWQKENVSQQNKESFGKSHIFISDKITEYNVRVTINQIADNADNCANRVIGIRLIILIRLML